jgi:uncharacterized membrane protein YoaK (UPF0700 family)
MAFQAGIINAGGFIACQRFVTHTTGFATYIGNEFAQGHIRAALSMVSVPLFFLAGATTSAYFIDRRIVAHKPPLYFLMFGFIAVAMLIVSIGGGLGLFGIFSEKLSFARDYALLAILCLSAGLQNGTITSAAGSVVRTTHLTGITTDLGLGLIRAHSSEYPAEVKVNETRANWMRIGIIGFFIFGSTIGALCFYRFGYWGFLWPALISTVLALMCLNYQLQAKRRSQQGADLQLVRTAHNRGSL